MIQDECDRVNCSEKATTEIYDEHNYYFVCDKHIKGEIVKEVE